jgi:hypothetical protein
MVHKKRGSAKKFSRAPQPNLWIVLSVAVLVVGLTVITTLGPSTVTGNTVQTISLMNKGDSLQMGVRDVPYLESIFTNAAEAIKSGKLTAEVDNSIPFNGINMSKFKVSSEGKFAAMQFRFKVKEQELLDKGISRGDLRLYAGLKVYSLQVLKVDHGYIYYLVTVPSVGNFVLGKETPIESVIEEKPASPVPDDGKAQPIPDDGKIDDSKGAVIGRAAELPPESEGKGFWASIVDFFRNLFS